MYQRALAAFKLLRDRIEAAKAAVPPRQLLVITHYPTKFLKYFVEPESGLSLQDLLKDPEAKIAFFAGHVHSTDNTTNVQKELGRPGWSDYCVGGGGGWACDAPRKRAWPTQGFVTGVVKSDGSVGDFEFHMKADSECCAGPHMVHSHTVHLPLGALLSPCTMCGTGAASRTPTASRTSPQTPERPTT